jgi:hypothetical protein
MKKSGLLIACHMLRMVNHAKRVASLMLFGMVFVQMTSADLTNTTMYVATNTPALGPGYPDWEHATNSIQGAIDAISNSPASTVWVSNGVYDAGGLTNYPKNYMLTNRVAIWKVITVRSANNDPTNTIIVGTKNNGTNGPAAVRCVYLTNGSSLIGFTLTNGATLNTGLWNNDNYGGGALCSGTLSNCVIAGNSAGIAGGGVFGGTQNNCTVVGNSVPAQYGAGAYGSTLYGSTISANTGNYGGGTYSCTLSNCVVISNTARFGAGVNASTLYNCTVAYNLLANQGGGAYNSTLSNCTLIGNSASSYGGGAYGSTLFNCLIASNSAQRGGGAYQGTLYNCIIVSNILASGSEGGGAYGATLYNCLLAGNLAHYGGGANGGTLNNCTLVGNSTLDHGAGIERSTLYNCISWNNNNVDYQPTAYYSCGVGYTNGGSVSGNITNDPMFIANGSGYGTNFVMGNYRLSQGSPCINTGSNQSWMATNNVDLDSHSRIDRFSGIVDMGCYEYLPAGSIYRGF